MFAATAGTKSKTESFMKNFDPVNSNREMRKFLRVQQSSGEDGIKVDGCSKRSKRRRNRIVYNEKGLLIHDLSDLCDCLDEKCVGCFFPCPKCRSQKCGTTCRVHRRKMVETIEVEGADVVFQNEHIPPSMSSKEEK